MKVFRNSIFVLQSMIVIWLSQSPATAQQSNWTHFRGSNLDGISNETGVPTIWNDSVNVIWKTKINGKGWSSPVVYGDQVWLTTATEDGKQMFGVCINFKTGKTLYTKRLTGKYNASPVYAGGNIYFTSTNGETLIIKEGRKLEIIARNRLKGEVFATPAITHNTIIIRAGTNLYCLGSR